MVELKVDPNKELIFYVNKNGVPTGETAPKLDAHNGNTKLHAAFSCFIFNENGEILVTRRANVKKVWPGVWTNSVCGHILPGETYEHAILRRAEYELGMKIKDLELILPNFIYKTPPYKGVIEHEYCPVYLARAASPPLPNPEEVDSFEWLKWDDFVMELQSDKTDEWSYWVKEEVKLFDPKILAPFIYSKE